MKKSLSQVISEKDFLMLAQDHSKNFLKIYNFFQKEHKTFTRRFYAHLIEESEELESFLDDHCARDNKTWYFFGELVACIRNLAKVAFTLKHLLNRYPSYYINGSLADQLLKNTRMVALFLNQTILALFEALKKESLELGIRFPRGSVKDELFPEIYPRKRLPYNIDHEDGLEADMIMAKIAAQYLEVIKRFDAFGWNDVRNGSMDLKEIVPNKVNEEKSREAIAEIHNLQSSYDHYIKRTPLESENEELKKFRGFIAIPMHLLSIVNWLAHLYQRHIHTTRKGKNNIYISEIINEKRILDIMINFALNFAGRYLMEGKHSASEILKKLIEVDTCDVKVPKKLGFHLRPATLIVKLAKHHGTKLSMVVDGKEFDAGSVLSVTMAAGLIARKGYQTVSFKGDIRVLADLKLLADYNYGQDENGNPGELPPELSHLWA